MDLAFDDRKPSRSNAKFRVLRHPADCTTAAVKGQVRGLFYAT